MVFPCLLNLGFVVQALDSFVDHALCFPDLGVYARHTHLWNELAEICSEMGLQVELEKGIPENG